VVLNKVRLTQWFRTTALLALFAACPTVYAAEKIRLATGELPPYATQERSDEGIALDIVRKAFAQSGFEVEYTFKPWMRSLEEARAGKFDGTAYWGRNAERDVGFLISDNVLTEQWVFVYRSGGPATSPLVWSRLEDLKSLRIGGIRSYTYTPEFWALSKADVLKVEFALDDLTNLRRLVAGRIDVVPMERNVACYLMAAHFKPEEVTGLRAHPKLLTTAFTTHLMLSSAVPGNVQRMKAFNDGLREIRKSKQFTQRLQVPGCTLGVPAP